MLLMKSPHIRRAIPFFLPALIAGFLLSSPGYRDEKLRAGLDEFAELRITVDPACAVFGDSFIIKVQGLKPKEQVSIKAVSRDSRGVYWESTTIFLANENGVIDVSKQTPLSGGYAEADVLGLLWSMQPQSYQSKRPPSYSRDDVNGYAVDFTITDSRGRTASARLRRVYQLPGKGLVRVPLEQAKLRGYLYHPAEGGPFPGVLILGGSGGGLYEWLAQAFASNGFAALTLAYFNYLDLPRDLLEIPLEYVEDAVVWLNTHPAGSVSPEVRRAASWLFSSLQSLRMLRRSWPGPRALISGRGLARKTKIFLRGALEVEDFLSFQPSSLRKIWPNM